MSFDLSVLEWADVGLDLVCDGLKLLLLIAPDAPILLIIHTLLFWVADLAVGSHYYRGKLKTADIPLHSQDGLLVGRQTVDSVHYVVYFACFVRGNGDDVSLWITALCLSWIATFRFFFLADYHTEDTDEIVSRLKAMCGYVLALGVSATFVGSVFVQSLADLEGVHFAFAILEGLAELWKEFKIHRALRRHAKDYDFDEGLEFKLNFCCPVCCLPCLMFARMPRRRARSEPPAMQPDQVPPAEPAPVCQKV